MHSLYVIIQAVSWQLKGRTDGIPRMASQYLVRQAFGPVSLMQLVTIIIKSVIVL